MRALLIPSAVLIPTSMRGAFGDLPTALFPLGKETMLEQIIKKYDGIVDEIYIVIYRRADLIEKFIKSHNLKVNIIMLDRLSDLGYTIKFGINKIIEMNLSVDYLYINFADSLIDENIDFYEKDIVFSSKHYSDEEWTYFDIKDGIISEILDKNSSESIEEEKKYIYKVFIGVFGIKNVDVFKHIINSTQSEKIDMFYFALMKYSELNHITVIDTEKWIDVGHDENYQKARTSVAARAFNTIEIDDKRGILKKTSENKEKLIDEIRWYLRLPNKLQYLLPRIYDYSLDFNNPYVSMEFYGYNTLHEILLYGDIKKKKWKDIFNKILFAINDMSNYQVSENIDNLKGSLRNIYLRKTFDRLDKIRDNDLFRTFFKNPVIINEKQYLTLDEYMCILPNLIEKVVIDTFSGKFNIIHGDLCFANILIEGKYNFIRLIDPRGSFGDFDIYGDRRYEIAKLMHTLEGNYDYIIEDKFVINVTNNTINYHIKNNNQDALICFMDTFSDEMNDINAIRLIEATLFLSMIPLHSDYATRQFAMLATGVILLNKVIEDLEEV